MDDRLAGFLTTAFAPYGDSPGRADVVEELLADMRERFTDLKAQGKSDDEAYEVTVSGFGDVAEIMEHVPHGVGQAPSASARTKKVQSSNLDDADLSGTALPGADFRDSASRRTNYEGSDLTGAPSRGPRFEVHPSRVPC